MQNILKLGKVDKILAISLILGLVLCLYGINWGRVEEWHPDQMAFIKLFYPGELPLNPKWFHKPPFHTYFNFFLSVLPFKILEKLHISIDFIRPARLLWSRTLTVFLFMGSIVLVFVITKRFFGTFAARMVTVIFSTSAGPIAFSHFLTTDIPVMFWMLLAFYFAQNILLRGNYSDYILAGFLTGIATATKYNGLGVGIAIIAAHALSPSFDSFNQVFFSKKLFLGLFMVLVGFLVGNPFALLDYSTFISDFMFNYIVTPVYFGNTGDSYLAFFERFSEIIGWPAFLIFLLAFLFSFYVLFKCQKKLNDRRALLLILSVLLLYYYKFGSFPRLPTRFVLPIVPLWMIVSGPFWNIIKSNRIFVSIILVTLISYNLVCDFYVGKRFVEDPRMAAQIWVKENISNGSSIETTRFSPRWNNLPGVKLKNIIMPDINTRSNFFKQHFKDNIWIVNHKSLQKKENTKWYTIEELIKRNPDYIAINYRYYNRFFETSGETNYPDIQRYFSNLLTEKYPYKIVFDRRSKAIPSWVYPQEIDSIFNRMTIFSRK